MMRTLCGVVAALGIVLARVQPVDACGVKLTVKAPKISRGVKRSSNPSKVLVLGGGSKRLALELSDSGHSVDVASTVDDAPRGQYAVVVTDANMAAAAKSAYPDSKIVVRSGSTRDDRSLVEASVGRTAIASNRPRLPTDTSRRNVIAAGGTDVKRTPVATGGGETEVAAARPAARTPRPAARTTRPTTDATTDTTVDKPADTAKATKPVGKVRVATTDEGDKPTPAVDEHPTPAIDDNATKPEHHASSGKQVEELVFGRAAWRLSGGMKSRLKQEAAWMAANPDKSITIEGHANATGTAEANQTLSEARAVAAKEFLVSLGVEDSRIQTVGFGFDKPAYQPASSGKNRRIHIVVNN